MDDERLERPYRQGERLADVLGVRTPALDSLRGEIANAIARGMQWPHSSLTADDIAWTADHAVVSIDSIETNLVEAAIHLADCEGAIAEDNARLAQVLTYGRNGLPQIPRMPPRVRPRDDLPAARVDMHMVGFFGALSGALDCLGAVIVFVGAFPTSLVAADFGYFSRLETRRACSPRQKSLLAAVNAAVDASGPPAWSSWTDGTRNAFSHRARRLRIQSFALHSAYAEIVDSSARPIRMWRPTCHLPREPRLVETAAIKAGPGSLALAEDARLTLRGALAAVGKLIAAVGTLLETLWRERSADPALLVQPVEHAAPRPSHVAPTNFDGFTGAGPTAFDVAIAAPATVDRIRRAAHAPSVTPSG